MQNNFNNLTKELNLLKNFTDCAPCISKLSANQLKDYLFLISKKEVLETKISKILTKKNNILEAYSSQNEKWLYNDKLNCRKYVKLEKRESYKRDSKLYKLGFLNSKPISPMSENLSNLKNSIQTTFVLPFSNFLSAKAISLKQKLKTFLSTTVQNSPICQMLNKFHYYSTSVLPMQVTTLAVSQVKKSIIGYRTLNNNIENSLHYFKRNINSAPLIQYFSYIGNQAKKEADLQSTSFISKIQVHPTITKSNLNNKIYSSNIKSDFDISR